MKLVLAVEQYLKDNIDRETTLESYDSSGKIPMFLRSLYKFYTMKILGKQYVLLEIIDEAPSIDTIKKHMDRI